MRNCTIYYGATAPIQARGVHQCRLLAFAEKYRGWHTFKQDRMTRRAIEALKFKQYIEIAGDQFRFKYPV